MSTELTDRHGFVRADCAACHNPDVWLTCNACKKSDRFVQDGVSVACACDTRYDHAVCTCGQQVPGDRLRWVPFEKGPAALSDWEIDRGRVLMLAIAALAPIALAAWYLLA